MLEVYGKHSFYIFLDSRIRAYLEKTLFYNPLYPKLAKGVKEYVPLRYIEPGAVNHDLEFFSATPCMDASHLESLFKKNSQIHIIGPAGSGKSSFSLYLAQEWAKNRSHNADKTVFWIPLRHLRHYSDEEISTLSLKTLFYKEFFNNFEKLQRKWTIEYGIPESSLESWLNQYWEEYVRRPVLFILDGLDELPRSRVLQFLNIFEHASHAHWNILITTRPVAEDLLPISWKHNKPLRLSLQGFDNRSIKTYIAQFCQLIQTQNLTSLPNQERQLRRFLKSNPSLALLARTPCNLELLCSIWHAQEGQLTRDTTTPIGTTEIYKRFLYHFCGLYLKNQEIRIDGFEKTTLQQCKTWLNSLENLAYCSIRDNRSIFDEEYIQDSLGCDSQIIHFIKSRLLRVSDDQIDPIKIAYSFSYVTMAEYLAARHILKKLTQKQLAAQCEEWLWFEKNQYDQRFALLGQFLFGLASRTEEICLSNMFFAPSKNISTPPLLMEYFLKGFDIPIRKDWIGIRGMLLQMRSLNACSNSNPLITQWICAVLQDSRPPLIHELVEALRSNYHIAEHPIILELWEKALSDNQEFFKERVYELLKKIGIRSKPFIRFLIAKFAHEAEERQIRIMQILSKLPSDNALIIEFFLTQVAHDNSRFATEALLALERLGILCHPSLETTMIKIFQTSELPLMRSTAMRIISQLQTPSQEFGAIYEKNSFDSNQKISEACNKILTQLLDQGYQYSIHYATYQKDYFENIFLSFHAPSLPKIVPDNQVIISRETIFKLQNYLQREREKHGGWHYLVKVSERDTSRTEWESAFSKLCDDKPTHIIPSWLVLLTEPTFPLQDKIIRVLADILDAYPRIPENWVEAIYTLFQKRDVSSTFKAALIKIASNLCQVPKIRDELLKYLKSDLSLETAQAVADFTIYFLPKLSYAELNNPQACSLLISRTSFAELLMMAFFNDANFSHYLPFIYHKALDVQAAFVIGDTTLTITEGAHSDEYEYCPKKLEKLSQGLAEMTQKFIQGADDVLSLVNKGTN